ncbi:hypothetical protein [Roseobacter sp.]|uniref:hypothetical protein n=1 Tax=Roseobacter sp. TaxID=1907202 RepID=UPI0029669562|nr:hypothetical protein [Roseobacter sp.]MDW3182800.1 hypothetical protein [Roseobacter sp.]
MRILRGSTVPPSVAKTSKINHFFHQEFLRIDAGKIRIQMPAESGAAEPACGFFG